MAVKLNSELAAFFQTGDQPSQTEFGHLVDSVLPTPVVVASGTATLVKSANQGRINIIPNLGAASTYTLPAPSAAGEYYRFIYGGVAEDAENFLLSSGAGTNVFLKGNITHLDTDAGGGNLGLYINGSSHQLLTLVDPGHFDVNVISISTTVWHVWGTVLSQDVPTIGD